MNKIEFYEINEKTKGKKGYLVFDDCTILFQNPKTNDFEVRTASVEIFGRAIKSTIQDDDGNPEYVYNNLSSSPIQSAIVEHLPGGLLWLLFNDVIMLSDEKLMSLLNEYAESVEEAYESYYLKEYTAELMSFPNKSGNNDSSANINNLTGIEFERTCQNLIEKMGFETEITKASGDGGIDLIAYNHQPLLSGKYIIQCKRYSGSVGEPIIRDLYGVVTSERANKGILITTGYFTKSAIEFAANKQIELIDGNKLLELLNTYHLEISNTSQNFRKKTVADILEDNFCNVDIYKESISTLINNPRDEIVRINLIQRLSSEALGSSPFVKSYEDRMIIFLEIKKHIELYSANINKSNKKTKYMKAILDMMYIQLSILEGDFTNAFKKYIDLINRPELHICGLDDIYPDIIDNRWIAESLYGTAYNMVQISLLSYDNGFIDKIFQMSKGVINAMQSTFALDYTDNSLTNYQKSFAKKQYDTLQQIKNFNSLFLMDNIIILKCSEFVYFNSPSFKYFTDNYPIYISDNSLVIRDEDFDEEYYRIDNWKKSISDAMLII